MSATYDIGCDGTVEVAAAYHVSVCMYETHMKVAHKPIAMPRTALRL